MAASEKAKDEVAVKPAESAPEAAMPTQVEAAAPAPVEPAKPAAVKAEPKKAEPAKKAVASKPAPKKVPVAKAAAKAVPAKPAAAKKIAAAKPAPAKPAPAKKVVPAKPAKAKPATPVAQTKPKPVAAALPGKATPPKAAAKTASTKTPAFAGLFTKFMLEEKTMDMSANFAGIQDAMAEAQTKAKAAFEKSTALMGEAGDFAKGNAEAVMESGKILAAGMQSMGSEIVSEGRTAFEAMTSDVKELAAAKSPTDFFKMQGDLMRKNFDSAVAYSSKNSEAMLKLMSDVMAPISGRVSLAMEKARSAAL